jgi:hypothetical protein
MAKTVYNKYTALTGGAATALDSVDGADLAEGDHAILYIGGAVYFYLLDENSAATESVPNVISPDDNAGDKRWVLQNQDHSPKENLLANSGFGVWSNSTLASGTTGRQADFEVGSAIRDDDPDDGDNSGDYSTGDCAIARTNDAGNGAGGDDYFYTITRDNPGGSPQYAYVGLTGLTVGKLYKFSCFVKDGTDAISAACEIQIRNAADNATIASTALAASGAWADFSVVWEATQVNNKIRIYLDIDAADETMLIDEIQVYEITPGCVAADDDSPDGWHKDATLDVYREHSGSNTKDGAFYSLKTVPSAQNDFINWPSSALYDSLEFADKFKGRTVTFGAWVKSSTASDLKLRLTDATDDTDSGYHTGGGDWEWLEVTKTIATDTTSFLATIIHLHASPGDAYISQPMLVFGNLIGEGNYTPKSNETIWIEGIVTSIVLHTVPSSGDIGWTDLIIEADTLGKLPKGIKTVFFRTIANDSGSAGGDSYVAFRIKDTILTLNINSLFGLANDASGRFAGWQPCDANGDIEYNIQATGADTLDITLFQYYGVQLR